MATRRPKACSLERQIGKAGGFDLPEQEAYLNLLRTCGSLAGEFDQLFAQHGLSDPQYNALRILRGHGKPMQVYQVAAQMVTGYNGVKFDDKGQNTLASSLITQMRGGKYVAIWPKERATDTVTLPYKGW